MANNRTRNTITMILPAGTRKPTQDEIKAAKQYILDRSDAADDAQYVAGVSIQEAAEQLVQIAYKYDIPVSRFSFDSEVNEDMMADVAEVMDDLEEDLMEDVRDAALSCTKDNERYLALLAILLTLGHRNMSLRDTVHAYAWRTLRQAEAIIAAMKAAGLSQSEARTKIKTEIQHFQVSPEFQAALKHPLDFAAPYIRNGGKATFPDGSPNVQGVPVNGYDAIKSIFGIAVAQIWMRNQLMDMQEDKRCIGYWQDRGSTYPCRMCDDEVGFHKLGDIENDPYPHCGCFCWRMAIYSNGPSVEDSSIENEDSSSKLFGPPVSYENGGEIQIAKEIDKEKSDYQDILTIARDFAKKGSKVKILKPYHVKSEEYKMVFGSLLGTKYWGKCPDLLIDGKFYEYESYQRPWNRRKVSNMLAHGFVQSSRIIIDGEGYTYKLLQNMIKARINNHGANIDEVFLFISGNVVKFYENGTFI